MNSSVFNDLVWLPFEDHVTASFVREKAELFSHVIWDENHFFTAADNMSQSE